MFNFFLTLFKKKKKIELWESDISQWNRLDHIFTNRKVQIAISEADYFIYLEVIKVKERYRCKGVGSKTIKKIIKYANFVKKPIALETSENMGSEINRLKEFYKRCGFKDEQLNIRYRNNMSYIPKTTIH